MRDIVGAILIHSIAGKVGNVVVALGKTLATFRVCLGSIPQKYSFQVMLLSPRSNTAVMQDHCSVRGALDES
jgi:hypothetical protein